MNGKIILNLAVSLDGYIAGEDGSFDWIVGQGDTSLDTESFDFTKFVENVDIVVMGKNCYDEGFSKDYKNKKVYIATSQNCTDYENVHFINKNIVDVIQNEKENGKNSYLFGGGKLIDSFIKANAIDEYIVAIIPTILGGGRPLFLGNSPKINLKLNKYLLNDGICILHYTKR